MSEDIVAWSFIGISWSVNIWALSGQKGPYNILQYVEYTRLKKSVKNHIFLLSFKEVSVLCDA